jgi:hypothetical protein
MLGETSGSPPLQHEYDLRDRSEKDQEAMDWTDSQKSMDVGSMTRSFSNNYSDTFRETLSIPEPTVVFTVAALLQTILALRAEGEAETALRF